MPSHKAQAQFERSRWRLLLLLPFWTIQVFLSIGTGALFSWRVGDTIKSHAAQDSDKAIPVIVLIWEGVSIAFSVATAITVIVEVFKYLSESLTPWTMLFTQTIKLSCVAAVMALNVVVYVQEHDKYYSMVGLGMDIAFGVATLVLALYAAVTYRRLSGTDDYAHPANFKAYGFNDGTEAETPSTGLLGRRRASTDKLAGWQPLPGQGSDSDAEEKASPPRKSMGVYHHRRDTLFDEYVARRVSSPSIHSITERQTAWAPVSPRNRSSSADAKFDIPTVIVTDMTDPLARCPSMGRKAVHTGQGVLVQVSQVVEQTPQAGDQEMETVIVVTAQQTGTGQTKRANYTPRDSVDYAPVLQEVDIVETRWAPSATQLR